MDAPDVRRTHDGARLQKEKAPAPDRGFRTNRASRPDSESGRGALVFVYRGVFAQNLAHFCARRSKQTADEWVVILAHNQRFVPRVGRTGA
jgi:hypothetical protein